MARTLRSKLGDNLKVLARQRFNNYVNEGNRVNDSQLRRLNTIWKKDYIGALMKESNANNEELELLKSDVQENLDESAEIEMRIHELNSEYDK